MIGAKIRLTKKQKKDKHIYLKLYRICRWMETEEYRKFFDEILQKVGEVMGE